LIVPTAARKPGVIGESVGAIGTALAQQRLRSILVYLNKPALRQPEAFIEAKDVLFDTNGNVGRASLGFIKEWMAAYTARLKLHAA